MGTMPWTVNSEIYPLWARSTGNALSSGVNWIFNVLVSLTFLHVAEFLTYYGKDRSCYTHQHPMNRLSGGHFPEDTELHWVDCLFKSLFFVRSVRVSCVIVCLV